MEKEEFLAVSKMLSKLSVEITQIVDAHTRELNEIFMGKKIYSIDCTECGKEHDPNKSCLEAGVEKLNV